MTRHEKKIMYDLLLIYLVEKHGLMTTGYEEAKQRIEMEEKRRKSLQNDL